MKSCSKVVFEIYYNLARMRKQRRIPPAIAAGGFRLSKRMLQQEVPGGEADEPRDLNYEVRDAVPVYVAHYERIPAGMLVM